MSMRKTTLAPRQLLHSVHMEKSYLGKAGYLVLYKVNLDNHNPVKTSNIKKPGATPQIFCKVCVIAEPKN